eukprot:3205551-Rhodomonas_salina.1
MKLGAPKLKEHYGLFPKNFLCRPLCVFRWYKFDRGMAQIKLGVGLVSSEKSSGPRDVESHRKATPPGYKNQRLPTEVPQQDDRQAFRPRGLR